jgi:hypothetical protein
MDRERHNEEYRDGKREDPFDDSVWVTEIGHEAFMWYFEGSLKDTHSMDKMFKRFENESGRLQFPEFACLILPDGYCLPNFGALNPNEKRTTNTAAGNFKIAQAMAYLSAAGTKEKEEAQDEKDKRKPDEEKKKKRRLLSRKEKPVDLVPPASYATDDRRLAGHDLGTWPAVRSMAAVAYGDMPEPYQENEAPPYQEPEVLHQTGYAA